MILFVILALIAIILLIAAVAVLSIGGAVGIFIFSDLIICVAIIILIIKKLIK